MNRRILLSGVFAALALVCFVVPQAHSRGRKGPVSVRMEAYVGDAPPGMGLDADWKIDVEGKMIRLAVTLLRVQTGNVSAQDIVRSREPYPVAFKVSGPTEMISALKNARAGQRLEILAYLRGAGSIPSMMVSQVRPVGPTPPSAP